MRLLSLNCQRALNPNFKAFFKKTLSRQKNKIFLLQEASEAVIKVAQKNLRHNYKIIRHKTPAGDNAEVCILHSRKLKCVDSSFSHIEDSDGKYSGILMASFKSRKLYLSTASVHLPAYLKPHKRLLAIKQVKEVFTAFLKKHPKTTHVVLAGDFNAIFPWEHGHHKTVLSSFLSPIKNKLGHTYHTSRLEPNSFGSKILYYLGKIGISFRPTLDYVFVNQDLLQRGLVRVSSQEKNVSDHLPLLIEIH